MTKRRAHYAHYCLGDGWLGVTLSSAPSVVAGWGGAHFGGFGAVTRPSGVLWCDTVGWWAGLEALHLPTVTWKIPY